MVVSAESPLTRSLRLLALFILLIGFPVTTLPAQTSVYGEVSTTNYGYTANGGTLRTGTDGVGGNFGAFYNFPIRSRLTAGVDAHVGFGTGSTSGVKGLVSARFGVVPYRVPFRPYVEIGGGFVSAHVPQEGLTIGPHTVTSGALEIGVGVDVRLTSRIDWRAIELEGAAGGVGSAGSAGLSTGVVYHFSPRVPQRP